MYATVTNIVAYLPFLLVTGSTGEFLFSLPIVMTVALVASRVVSMTFLPLLGYYLLRPEEEAEESLEEQREHGFFGLYARQQNTRSNIVGNSSSLRSCFLRPAS